MLPSMFHLLQDLDRRCNRKATPPLNGSAIWVCILGQMVMVDWQGVAEEAVEEAPVVSEHKLAELAVRQVVEQMVKR